MGLEVSEVVGVLVRPWVDCRIGTAGIGEEAMLAGIEGGIGWVTG